MKLASRLAALAVLLFAAPAFPITFTKVADAATLGWLPENTTFGTPSLDNGVVAFRAFENLTGYVGIFTGSDGPLTPVVDSTTLIPGQTFGWLYDPSISGGSVAFVGNDENYYPAVYTNLGGTLSRIAEIGMPDPDGSGTLQPADVLVSIHGANVAFLAYHEYGYPGLYTSVAGALERTADETTPLPGGDGTTYLDGPPSLDATGIAFAAFSGSVAGIYVANGGVARVVADTNTPAPGDLDNFTAFDRASIASDAGNTVFEAVTATGGGLYAEIGGALTKVSDELILGESISGDDVAWQAQSSALVGDPDWYTGLYLLHEGQRIPVIEAGDPLDGRVVSDFALGHEALSGDQLAFTAYFEDGTQGVYVAAIPEPGGTAMLASGCLALAALRQRRQAAR